MFLKKFFIFNSLFSLFSFGSNAKHSSVFLLISNAILSLPIRLFNDVLLLKKDKKSFQYDWLFRNIALTNRNGTFPSFISAKHGAVYFDVQHFWTN